MRLLAAVAALLLLTAPAAGAQGVLDPVDAQALAVELAEATEAQGVCYGWTVRVDDATGVYSGVSTGSSFGAGVSLADPAARGCAKRVEFVGEIVYTSESSEASDSASFAVVSTPSGPTTDDLEDLSLFDADDLAGDEVDVLVARAVTALPQLAADAGIAPPLVAEPVASAAPDAGALSDDPGSDYLRRAGGLLAIGAVLLVGGVAFGGYVLTTSRGAPPPPPQHTPNPPSAPNSPPHPPYPPPHR